MAVPLRYHHHYTRQERQLIESCKTPSRVQAYLSSLNYNFSRTEADDAKSFRAVVRTHEADCLEGALAAAAILENFGHRLAILDLVGSNPNDDDHVVLAYEENGFFGGVGKSSVPKLEGRNPIYSTEEELAMSYWKAFATPANRLHSYGIVYFDKFLGIDWKFSNTGLRGIEGRIIQARHIRLNPPKPIGRKQQPF